jgi:hypothetical protein
MSYKNEVKSNKPVVFLTTPTSATASMWRIIQTISGSKYKLIRFTDDFYHKGQLEDIQNTLLPIEARNLLLFNTPMFFNFEQPLGEFRYLINVRDPRDLLCNMYHWALIHPDPAENDAAFNERIRVVKEIGINKFVLNKDIKVFYANIIKLWNLKNDLNLDVVPVTYSNLCTNFDVFISKISSFLSQELTDNVLLALSNERVDKLTENKDWIGNQWQGSDILPGRYLEELDINTIEQLNINYEQEIAFCNLLDGEES